MLYLVVLRGAKNQNTPMIPTSGWTMTRQNPERGGIDSAALGSQVYGRRSVAEALCFFLKRGDSYVQDTSMLRGGVRDGYPR